MLWRLPLGKAYEKHIKSDIADIKNIGRGREAGSTAGAVFLQHFVGDVPWAHLDIAGMAWSRATCRSPAKGATGFGVRLLDRLVADRHEAAGLTEVGFYHLTRCTLDDALPRLLGRPMRPATCGRARGIRERLELLNRCLWTYDQGLASCPTARVRRERREPADLADQAGREPERRDHAGAGRRCRRPGPGPMPAASTCSTAATRSGRAPRASAGAARQAAGHG